MNKQERDARKAAKMLSQYEISDTDILRAAAQIGNHQNVIGTGTSIPTRDGETKDSPTYLARVEAMRQKHINSLKGNLLIVKQAIHNHKEANPVIPTGASLLDHAIRQTKSLDKVVKGAGLTQDELAVAQQDVRNERADYATKTGLLTAGLATAAVVSKGASIIPAVVTGAGTALIAARMGESARLAPEEDRAVVERAISNRHNAKRKKGGLMPSMR